MKKAFLFYLKHFFSISVFLASVVLAFIYGWQMIILGVLLGLGALFCEAMIIMIFARPSKKRIKELGRIRIRPSEFDPSIWGGL